MWRLQIQELLQGRVLDYGCGRGFDADQLDLEKYDPHWFPKEPEGLFDTITCIYVLNVVSEETQTWIIENVSKLLTPGGHAYFAVRRDLPREGEEGRGTWQQFVLLDLPLLTQKSTFAIYKLSK